MRGAARGRTGAMRTMPLLHSIHNVYDGAGKPMEKVKEAASLFFVRRSRRGLPFAIPPRPFREKSFFNRVLRLGVASVPTKNGFYFERRQGQEQTRENSVFSNNNRNDKKGRAKMAQQFVTVSVRLSKPEYDALQAIAKETYNTMSGVLRGLLNRAVKGGAQDGTGNSKTE